MVKGTVEVPVFTSAYFGGLAGIWSSLLWFLTYWHDVSRRRKNLGPLPPFKGLGIGPIIYPHVLLERARSNGRDSRPTRVAWPIRIYFDTCRGEWIPEQNQASTRQKQQDDYWGGHKG